MQRLRPPREPAASLAPVQQPVRVPLILLPLILLPLILLPLILLPWALLQAAPVPRVAAGIGARPTKQPRLRGLRTERAPRPQSCSPLLASCHRAVCGSRS